MRGNSRGEKEYLTVSAGETGQRTVYNPEFAGRVRNDLTGV
jgi:hypothetical protein